MFPGRFEDYFFGRRKKNRKQKVLKEKEKKDQTNTSCIFIKTGLIEKKIPKRRKESPSP